MTRLEPKLRNLRVLRLDGTGVSDDSLNACVGAGGFAWSPVADASWVLPYPVMPVHMSENSISHCLPALELLSLRGCRRVSDKGIAHLLRLKQLKGVELACPLVNLTSVRQLTQLPQLEFVAVRCVRWPCVAWSLAVFHSRAVCSRRGGSDRLLGALKGVQRRLSNPAVMMDAELLPSLSMKQLSVRGYGALSPTNTSTHTLSDVGMYYLPRRDRPSFGCTVVARRATKRPLWKRCRS